MSHLDFALAVHRAVAAPGEQVCWSPFSVAGALGLLTHGAGGATRAELVGLLGDLDELTARVADASTLDPVNEYHEGDHPVLTVANTLWADARVPVEPAFAAELARRSGGTVRNAPFQAEPEKARQAINADVADTTRRLIPELLDQGTITEDTAAVLVNALYLKCPWADPFTAGGTEPRPFHTADGPVDVPTMVLDETIGHARLDGWTVLSLPAAGGVDAVVLLPDGDLTEAEDRLGAAALAALLAATTHREPVFLRLPALKVTGKLTLTGTLKTLGVRTVFTDDADLTAISPAGLAVDDVIHEAVLKLDEQGFEGAAATAITMRMTSVGPVPVEVTVDRPFLLLVRHTRTDTLYFLARVTNPT